MKILHLLSTNYFSGAENVVCQIIKAYEKDKNVEMFYCSPNGKISEKLKEIGVSYVEITKLSARELNRVVKENNIDMVHAHDIKASLVSIFLSSKIPVVSHVHTNASNMKKVSVKSFLYMLSTYRYKHIFWVSPSTYNEYVFKKMVSKKSSVLINIVDMKRIKDSVEKIDEYFDVIFVGRLTDVKDPFRLLEVIKKVSEKMTDVKMAIIGQGELKDSIIEKIEELKIENNVDVLGYKTNSTSYMNNSKVMLMTSKFEGTPMCALEAMSLGLPIVSTPTDGMVDLIIDGKTGYLSKDNDVLASKLVDLLSDDKLYKEMKKNVIKNALKVNDVKSYKKCLSEVYFK